MMARKTFKSMEDKYEWWRIGIVYQTPDYSIMADIQDPQDKETKKEQIKGGNRTVTNLQIQIQESIPEVPQLELGWTKRDNNIFLIMD